MLDIDSPEAHFGGSQLSPPHYYAIPMLMLENEELNTTLTAQISCLIGLIESF